jgi:hypothetical protein
MEKLSIKHVDKKRQKLLAKAPKTFDEAMEAMDKLLDSTGKAYLVKVGHLGFFGGMSLRNSWGLWFPDQPIAIWFRERGIWHADDMSGLLVDGYRAKLTGEKFNLKKEIKFYIDYWKKKGLGFDGVEFK